MKVFIPFLIYIALVCSKDCVGMNFDFIPEDVRTTIDTQIITPVRDTFLGAIARKIGFVDFFVNLIRGTKHTFFGSPRKEPRKPRNGYPQPQPTTRVYEPILYQDTGTSSPLQIAKLNGNGIYMMTAPDLGSQIEILNDQVTNQPFEILDTPSFPDYSVLNSKPIPELITEASVSQKLKSNPFFVSPLMKPNIHVTGNDNIDNFDDISSNMLTSNEVASGFPSLSFIQNEMKKVANLPSMFENIEPSRSPFHLYQMSNYTIRSQNDHLHFLNERRANFSRVPMQHTSPPEQLISMPSQLSTSITKQIHFRRLNNPDSKIKKNTPVEKAPTKLPMNNSNRDRLQVLTRSDVNERNKKEDKIPKDNESARFVKEKMDVEHDINTNNMSKDSKPLNSLPKEQIDELDADGIADLVGNSDSTNDFEDISLDGAHNITMGRMNKDNNTSAQNTSTNTSDTLTHRQVLRNISNIGNDDIIHRFQFFYLPKRNAYGFSSDKIKKINRKSRNSNISRLKRKKRRNF